MRVIAFILVYIFIIVPTYAQTSSDSDPAVNNEPVTVVSGATVRVDGQWLERDFYIVNGIIKWSTDQEIIDTLYVQNKFITPGFADAHTHNLDRAWQRGLIDQYLSEGALSIMNLTSKSGGTADFREYMSNRPSPRVRYSNWGFTSTLGHPFVAYEPFAMGLNDPSKWSENIDSISNSRLDLYESYAFVDSVSQLQNIWPEFLETNPDQVKIYYFNEEGIDDQVPGGHGLRLTVAKAIIDSAHASGLQVFAHIETKSDFEVMIDAGVDGFAHMPGYGWSGDTKTYESYYLPDALLQKAADKDIVIIPTAALNAIRNSNDKAALNAAATFQNDLIRRYRAMGGTIAAGTDAFAQTAGILYSYYAEHIHLPADEKLDLLTTETTRVILPDLQTGRISDGYKADFLVFSEKPFESGSWKKPEYVFLEGRLVADNSTDN